jgi:hypothetical protein
MKTRKTKLVERATKNSAKWNNVTNKHNIKPNKIKVADNLELNNNSPTVTEPIILKNIVCNDDNKQSNNQTTNTIKHNVIALNYDKSDISICHTIPKHQYDTDSSGTDTEDEDDDSICSKHIDKPKLGNLIIESTHINTNNENDTMNDENAQSIINEKKFTNNENNFKNSSSSALNLYNHNLTEMINSNYNNCHSTSIKQNTIGPIYVSKIQAYTRNFIFRGLKIVTNDHFHPKCELMPKLLELVDFDEDEEQRKKETYMIALKKIVKDTLNSKRGHVKRKIEHELQGMCI